MILLKDRYQRTRRATRLTGPELKARRKELGLTMQDVADRVGLVHRQQVYEWERGKVRPGRKHLRRLAMVLQVSMLDLIATPQKASLPTERTTNNDV